MGGKGREDNFGNLVANGLTTLFNVPGHHEFTPERLRYYKDGSRRFLQYGSDSNYSETDHGHLLSPGSDMMLEIRTSLRVSYPVGSDLIKTLAYGMNGSLSTGDVVAGGWGNPDVEDFDPVNKSYSNSTADGVFWYFTEDTGFSSVFLAMVRNGTILYSTTESVDNAGDIFGILTTWGNWYGVGPERFFERYTDIANNKGFPQMNNLVGTVANDGGKSYSEGSKRYRCQIYQASGNSGLELEMGSIAVQVPGNFDYEWKVKNHQMTVNNNDTTRGTFEVVGALKVDGDQPLVNAQVRKADVVETPSSSTNARAFFYIVDPSSTNLTAGDFSVPNEHSEKNSVIRQAIDDTATGPDANGSTTDISGPEQSETMTNPGGYQVGTGSKYSQGTGSKQEVQENILEANRAITYKDYALLLLDSDEAGTHRVDVTTAQNN